MFQKRSGKNGNTIICLTSLSSRKNVLFVEITRYSVKTHHSNWNTYQKYFVPFHGALFRTFAETPGVSNPLPFLFFCHSRRPISQIIITKLWRVDCKGWQKNLTNGSKVVAKEFEQRLLRMWEKGMIEMRRVVVVRYFAYTYNLWYKSLPCDG